jgi:hypothetical protein
MGFLRVLNGRPRFDSFWALQGGDDVSSLFFVFFADMNPRVKVWILGQRETSLSVLVRSDLMMKE